MSLSFDDLQSILTPHLQCKRWIVGYSGGLDSHVLLNLLSDYLASRTAPKPLLLALHVNHNLQEQAADWQRHCETQCQQLGVSYRCITVAVEDKSSTGLEAAARKARYKAFESLLEEDDLLLLGHHLDDQAETFLLRSLRGAGSLGLGAMPASRRIGAAQLLRPLLHCQRQDLLAYGTQHVLSWIEDDSNTDTQYSRNFLRHDILPLIEVRWPSYRETLGRAQQHNDEAWQLNQALAAIDLENLDAQSHRGGNFSLCLSLLRTLPWLRQKNLIRYWLMEHNLPVPEAKHFNVLFDELIDARPDATPCFRFGDLEMHRFQSRLYCMQHWPPFEPAHSYEWQPQQELDVPGAGSLRAVPSTGVGLRPCSHLTVKFRRGGERCQPVGRDNSQSLKKLLQEQNVPSWWRARIPLIYQGDELVAVAGFWICEGHVVNGDETGWRIDWLF